MQTKSRQESVSNPRPWHLMTTKVKMSSLENVKFLDEKCESSIASPRVFKDERKTFFEARTVRPES